MDSISYYTFDLADCNKKLYSMQKRKSQIALTGNATSDAETWLSKLMISANDIADQIMIDSAVDNSLRANYSSMDERFGVPIPQAELMASHYGSFGYKHGGMSPRTTQCLPYAKRFDSRTLMDGDEKPLSGPVRMDSVVEALSSDEDSTSSPKTPSSEQLLVCPCIDSGLCPSSSHTLTIFFCSTPLLRRVRITRKSTEYQAQNTMTGALFAGWQVE